MAMRSSPQDEWLRRCGLCFGCMRKTNEVPPSTIKMLIRKRTKEVSF